MKNNNEEIAQSFMRVAKRIAITVLWTLPFLLIFAFLMRNIITSDALQIAIFVLIMGIVVLIEELIVRAKEKRKKDSEILEDKKDVFK